MTRAQIVKAQRVEEQRGGILSLWIANHLSKDKRALRIEARLKAGQRVRHKKEDV